MTRHARVPTVALLLLSLAVPVLGQNYFLYTPQPVSAEEKSSVKEGVLVREITVRKGDTLSALSRRFSGRASYYPQILLFNDIRNPHLIHIGDNLKVPVTKAESPVQRTPAASAANQKTTADAKPSAAPVPKQTPAAKPESVSDLSLSDLKHTPAATSGKRSKREQKQSHKQRKPATANEGASSAAHGSNKTGSGKKLYEKAHSAYRQGNCKSALELFDRFLAEYPASSQAPDASLYKADCYLKLSGQ